MAVITLREKYCVYITNQENCQLLVYIYNVITLTEYHII